MIISFTALGIGLIAFPWVLLKTGLPEGFARILVFVFMGLFLALFAPTAISPRFRGFMISFTGIGLKARIERSELDNTSNIVNHDPDPVVFGEHKELKLWA